MGPQFSHNRQAADEAADHRVIHRAIMAEEDPMVRARDILTRHLGITIGASMLAVGIHTGYHWRDGWLWLVLALLWGLMAAHCLVFLTRRIFAAAPPPPLELEDDPDAGAEADAPSEPPAAEPRPGQGLPRHKITIFEPDEPHGKL